jgi:hypothetical protein
MSEHERGAYAPPTEASLHFDARQPVRGASPIPFTLIISVLVMLGLAAAIFVFYRSGVRQAGQPPQAVGAPVGGMKAPPPAEAQPQDPAAGLQIYKSEADQPYSPGQKTVQFAPPPEQPDARPQPGPPAPAIVVTPAAPASAAPALRPSISTQPLAPATSAPAAKAEAPASKPAPAPAPKVEAPPEKALPKAAVAKPAPAKPAPAKPAPTKPAAVAPAPAPAAKHGVAAVQIGAFSSQALADKGWSDAAATAPGAAAGKGKSVEKVEKDGHTLFRTKVTGFASRADATAFCAKLKGAGKACFVK